MCFSMNSTTWRFHLRFFKWKKKTNLEAFRKSFECTLQIFPMATWPSSLGQHGEAQGGEASAKACGDFGVSEAIEQPNWVIFRKWGCFMLEIFYEFILSKPFSFWQRFTSSFCWQVYPSLRRAVYTGYTP